MRAFVRSTGNLSAFAAMPTALALVLLCLAGCMEPVSYGEAPPPLASLAIGHAPAPLLPAEPLEDAPPPLVAREEPPADVERQVVLGLSVEGRPIVMNVLGDGGDVTFIFAGIHGNEIASVDLAQALLEALRADPAPLAGRTVALLVQANPDGVAAQRRPNANGVDLNRNFPAENWRSSQAGQYFGGSSPGSEPETQAIVLAIEQLQPSRIVSIHSIDRGRQCNNFDGPAHRLAALMHTRNGYPVKATIGYPTPGSFGSWTGVDCGVPTITLELPHGAAQEQFLDVNLAALRAAIEAGQTLHVGR